MRFEWSLKLRWQRLKACTANCRINNQPNEPYASIPELPSFSHFRCNVYAPLPGDSARLTLANKNKAHFNLSSVDYNHRWHRGKA